MTKKIEGVLAAILTPFDGQGEYDPLMMAQQVKRQAANGNGIFCCGTNGEFFVLSEREKIAITETCVQTAGGSVPVVSHIGEISTRNTLRLGKQIAALGVDAVSVITPWFVPLKQHELIRHFTQIADAITAPMYLYNIPARTGNALRPETVRELARHPQIIGIKDTTGTLESLQSLIDATKDIEGFDVLTGPDALVHEGFVAGAVACISGMANIAPAVVQRVWAEFKAGNITQSRRAQESLGGLRKELGDVSLFFSATVKKAVQLMGHDAGESRFPVYYSAEDEEKIRQILERYR
ncbi:dihydrodipicolinate synthase family protein [Martelella alba]|uniref:Dihydrodipicolinate synthase family protein n=1 Tax=Martelella alba TaxID=2590451 RepID=A0ABY2SG55_9HYPH|nr:dihydrodipicolinate synthase family protein [Martelella alba]TKI03371.1 dihydrodipicolinate synthase family protein [Martelella alba]